MRWRFFSLYSWPATGFRLRPLDGLSFDLCVEARITQWLILRAQKYYSLAPLIQVALDNIFATLPEGRIGGYVFVMVYDATKRQVARSAAPGIQSVDRFIELLSRQSVRFPPGDVVLGDVVELVGSPHVPVAVSITDEEGEIIGYLNGLFAISGATLAAIERSVWQTALLAIAIVVVTTVTIYPIIRRLMSRLISLSMQLLDANLETFAVLGSAIVKRDSDTDAHNYRVTVYTVRLAEATGLDVATIRTLIKGSFLHDVGKIGVRDNILLKLGPLDEDEFEEMKRDVVHGVEIVQRARWLQEAMDVVAYHHQRSTLGVAIFMAYRVKRFRSRHAFSRSLMSSMP